jgi:hypothetical protein
MARRKDFDFFYWLNEHISDVRTEFEKIYPNGIGLYYGQLTDLKQQLLKKLDSAAINSFEAIKSRYLEFIHLNQYISKIPPLETGDIKKKFDDFENRISSTEYYKWFNPLDAKMIVKPSSKVKVIVSLPETIDTILTKETVHQVDVYTRLMMFKVVFNKTKDVNIDELFKKRNHFIVASWIREKERVTVPPNSKDYILNFYFGVQLRESQQQTPNSNILTKQIYESHLLNDKSESSINIRILVTKNEQDASHTLNMFLDQSNVFHILEKICHNKLTNRANIPELIETLQSDLKNLNATLKSTSLETLTRTFFNRIQYLVYYYHVKQNDNGVVGIYEVTNPMVYKIQNYDVVPNINEPKPKQPKKLTKSIYNSIVNFFKIEDTRYDWNTFCYKIFFKQIQMPTFDKQFTVLDFNPKLMATFST